MAGQGYVWGFSFILTFLVSVLHLIFTALMYGIWWTDARQVRSGKKKQNLFSHATFMVISAQRQYGEEISECSPEWLEQEIVKGEKGLSLHEGVSFSVYRRHTDAHVRS